MFWRAAALGAALCGMPQFAAAQDDARIDLKLFGRQEIGAPKGCSVSLWQANRNPDKDRYAFVFHEVLAADHARQPARVEIGGKVVPFRRVAIGGRDRGYRLFDTQLYKSTIEDYHLVVEVMKAEEGGEAVSIDEATIVLSKPGKLPFRMSVKGGAGCMTPAAPEPPADLSHIFRRYEPKPASVPRALLTAAQKRFECNPDVARRVGVVGWQLSEESALWEIPCDAFAYNATSVFAVVHVERPAEHFEFLAFPAPPGKKREQPFVLMNPVWDAKARTVSSFAMGRGAGDCGTYEVHTVVDGQFRLLELREKAHCDGKETPPSQYPLVYKAR